MIDPKELRIGNLVSTNVDTGTIIMPTGFPFIVYTIGFSGCEILNDLSKPWAQQEPFPAKYNRLEPIPITPEWLERLGFKSDQFFDDTRPIFYLGDFYIDWDTLQPQDCGFDIAKIKIKYIHQLQNLYHALTGQELTVKELTAI